MEEYHLKRMYRSPNGTIRDILDGTTFRAPILVSGIEPAVKSWKRPITIARHSSADQYSAAEYRVPGPGTAELSFTGEDGQVWKKEICRFTGPGVLQGIYNRDESIRNFARACFAYALTTGQDLWFSAKDTICKAYDGTFRDIMGVAACLMLPEDKHAKILGVNNRVFYAVALTTLSVCIECFLNWCGVLTWEYSWWSRSCPWLIWLIGYLPFFTMSKDFDMVALETTTNRYLGGDSSLSCSEATAADIDKKVVALVRAQHEKALGLLRANEPKLRELADYLNSKETITGEEFMKILNAKAK